MIRPILLALNMLLATNAFADEPALSEPTEIEPAPITTSARQSKGKLSLYVEYGFGQSAQNSFLMEGGFAFEFDPGVEFMYEQLGIEFTEDFIPLTWTANYSIKEGFGFYGIIPTGIVQTRSDRPIGGIDFEEDFTLGIGDITAGAYYRITQESSRMPYISISFDVNTNTAKHSSLGDGLQGYTLGLYIRKNAGKSIYLVGSAYHTLQDSSGGIEPGGISGVSGGLGFAIRGIANEIRLSYTGIRPIDYRGHNIISRNDNLALIISSRGLKASRSKFARMEYRMYINNLSDGLEIDESSFGMTMVMPLLGR